MRLPGDGRHVIWFEKRSGDLHLAGKLELSKGPRVIAVRQESSQADALVS
jgi:hypothetical protein